jgi:nitrite reductase (cytochrome c-552)
MKKSAYIVIVLLVAAATIAVMLLLQNILTRKREAQQVVFSLVDLNETVVDPEGWGKYFPRLYVACRRTVDM